MRRALVLLALSFGQSATPVPAEVRVGVFGLFHPEELVVSAAGGIVSLRGDRNSCVLRGGEEARVNPDGSSVRVACAATVFSTGSLHVTGPTGESADLQLSVPGRIARRYRGQLDVTLDGVLVPVMSIALRKA
jgi:hypothetical protein